MNNQIKLTADQINEFANFMAGKALTHIVDQNLSHHPENGRPGDRMGDEQSLSANR